VRKGRCDIRVRIRLIGLLLIILASLLTGAAGVMSLIGDPGTRSLRLIIVLVSLPIMIGGLRCVLVAYRRGQWP
jgi:hypothetical protein